MRNEMTATHAFPRSDKHRIENGSQPDIRDLMTATLKIYKWSSQAFWRYFELQALKLIDYERPILEIGCGDGQFSSLVFREIDDAIDINPRAVDKCRRLASHLYRRVQCLDARELQFSEGGYGTVYANCVMEHIPDIEGVLKGCYRGLRPGGTLVATVPLVQMNEHLLFPWSWYAKVRQQQLVHLNLFTQQEWKELLLSTGFSDIQFRTYLSGQACKFWDTLDSVGCLGFGRYRLAPILGKVFELLPTGLQNRTLARLSGWLTSKAKTNGSLEPACAVVVIARK
jgi:SAM-dependent methyltransferase